MPRFQYRALRPSGGEITGELVAADERDVAVRLQAAGDYPIEAVTMMDRIVRRVQVDPLYRAGLHTEFLTAPEHTAASPPEWW